MIEVAAQIMYTALAEVGRTDLAEVALWFTNDDGSLYVEVLDDVEPAELSLIEQAERLALEWLAR